MTVIADHVTMIGDSLVYAGGKVQVDRAEVQARGDSMALDSQAELMHMMRGPSIAQLTTSLLELLLPQEAATEANGITERRSQEPLSASADVHVR